MKDPFHTTKKLTKRIAELKAYRFQKVQDLTMWSAKEDKSKTEKHPPEEWDFTLSVSDFWQGRDRYIWAHHELTVPEEEDLWLLIDFGRTGGGYNSGFESLLLIDGEPYQGVDSNHTEIFLADHYRGKTIRLDLKLWSGLEGGGAEVIQRHEFRQAYLAKRHLAADDCFFLADMMAKTIDGLPENEPIRYKLLNLLDDAFRLIQWQVPGSISFYHSVEEADHYLNQELQKIPKLSEITVTAIGHTHIDVAWLWRLKHTGEKAVRSFSTVLRLMEQYPEYIFLQTQPQLYKYVKESYPALYEKIKKRIKEGRWEVDGAMWLEADCNIPSGESLVRQILHGKKFVKEEFDKEMHFLWLPDVFGYSWALPQILKKSGIETFMTTKISWNQYNRMPHDTFYWRGIDGTDILTHFITTPVDGKTDEWAEEWFYTYNGTLSPETVQGIYDGYQDKRLNQEFLLSYGHGDGGGGVTREMLENRRRLDQIPGLPQVKTGKAKAFFERLHQTVEQNKPLVSRWDGELYLEYHRGTYTSQAFVKKMNRKAEIALRELEILYTCLAASKEDEYPKDSLFETWETVLRNQFHDIIPGSSIKEVYQDHRAEFAVVTQTIQQLFEKLNGPASQKYTVINTAGWSRNELVELPLLQEGRFIDSQGKELPAYFDGEKQSVLVANVPPLSQVMIEFQPIAENKDIKPLAVFTEGALETDRLRILWETSGNLISIFDKKLGREMLEGKGNVFQLFEDKPLNYDAWDIDSFYQEKATVLQANQIRLRSNNALYASVVFEYTFGNSQIDQEMRVYAHTQRIDFLTNVSWHERQQLLKVNFDAAIRSTEAVFDIQYGNVKRATHANTSWQLAQFETVGHQWADLSEKYSGVSLLNDCKYGYAVKENQLSLTLLKGAIYPDPLADDGDHKFTYSFYAHEHDAIDGGTMEEAWSLNSPLTVINGEHSWLLPLQIDCETSVTIDAIKQAETGKGWILRLHDHTGGTRKVTLQLPSSFWQETDLMEIPLNNEQWKDKVSFTLSPFEIKTFHFYLD